MNPKQQKITQAFDLIIDFDLKCLNSNGDPVDMYACVPAVVAIEHYAPINDIDFLEKADKDAMYVFEYVGGCNDEWELCSCDEIKTPYQAREAAIDLNKKHRKQS